MTTEQPTVTERITGSVHVEHQANDEWKVTASDVLTDEQALALTFRAAPDQVRLGRFVAVHDPEGVRIGRVSAATYRERFDGPAYVVCHISLL